MYKLFQSSNVPEDLQISISLETRYETEFTKVATTRDLPKEVDEAIKNLARKKDHSYVLVTAMGDGETWGENKNGDYFPFDGLMGVQNTPVWKEVAGKDERANEEMKAKERYKTFADGHFFHHHKNKIEHDPHFGYVPASIWNPKMRTVLLIIGIDNKKDPETAEMIARNELLAVSMGAKLPWDRCSICKSKHKTLLQYCPHLRNQMHQTLPDGRKVYAENLFPRFFDISKVTRPAFLAGMQLEKVARQNGDMLSVDLADYYDIGQFDKQADVSKNAILYKELPAHVEGTVARVCNTEKDLPHQLMNDLSKMQPQHAWGALTKAGIIAKPNEFAYILLKHDGHDELAEKFLHAHATVSKEHPKGLDEKLHGLAQIEINHHAVKLANSIPDHILDERSIGTLENRIYKTDKGLRKEAGVVGNIGLGSILSALYMIYRKNAESTFNAYGLLGAGISQMVRDTPDGPKFLGNDSVTTDLMNKKAEHEILKTIGKGFAGFTIPYIAAAHYQNKVNNGENVGVLGRFAANNPGKLGVVGGLAAIAGPKRIKTTAINLGSDIASAAKKVFKK